MPKRRRQRHWYEDLGLEADPFATPPATLFGDDARKQVLGEMLQAASRTPPILVVTGVGGVGKSTLLRAAKARIADDALCLSVGGNLFTDAAALTKQLWDALPQPEGSTVKESVSARELGQALAAALKECASIHLLVDDADEYGDDCLEQLVRLGTSLSRRAFRVVLMGDEGLEARFAEHPKIERMRFASLPALDAAGTAAYLRTRLRGITLKSGDPLRLTDDELGRVIRHAQGNPAKIEAEARSVLRSRVRRRSSSAGTQRSSRSGKRRRRSKRRAPAYGTRIAITAGVVGALLVGAGLLMQGSAPDPIPTVGSNEAPGDNLPAPTIAVTPTETARAPGANAPLDETPVRAALDATSPASEDEASVETEAAVRPSTFAREEPPEADDEDTVEVTPLAGVTSIDASPSSGDTPEEDAAAPTAGTIPTARTIAAEDTADETPIAAPAPAATVTFEALPESRADLAEQELPGRPDTSLDRIAAEPTGSETANEDLAVPDSDSDAESEPERTFVDRVASFFGVSLGADEIEAPADDIASDSEAPGGAISSREEGVSERSAIASDPPQDASGERPVQSAAVAETAGPAALTGEAPKQTDASEVQAALVTTGGDQSDTRDQSFTPAAQQDSRTSRPLAAQSSSENDQTLQGSDVDRAPVEAARTFATGETSNPDPLVDSDGTTSRPPDDLTSAESALATIDPPPEATVADAQSSQSEQADASSGRASLESESVARTPDEATTDIADGSRSAESETAAIEIETSELIQGPTELPAEAAPAEPLSLLDRLRGRRPAGNENSTSVEPARTAPRPAVSNNLAGEREILEMSGDAMVLQVMVLSSATRAALWFAEQRGTGNYAAYARGEGADRTWVVLQGPFEDRAQAEAAARDFERRTGVSDPWVRSVADVQAEIEPI